MIWKVVSLLGVAVCVLGDGHAFSEQKVELHFGHHGDLKHIGSHEPEHHEGYAWAYPSYEFSYEVKDPHTHDFKGQHEKRHGDEVHGAYWLIQPDGHKRTVKYHADKHSGFHAKVEYEKVHDIHHVPQHHAEEVVEHYEPVLEEMPAVVEEKPVVEEQDEEQVTEAPVEEHHTPKHHHKKVIEFYQKIHHPHHEHKHHEHKHHEQKHHEHKSVHEHWEIHHEEKPVHHEQEEKKEEQKEEVAHVEHKPRNHEHRQHEHRHHEPKHHIPKPIYIEHRVPHYELRPHHESHRHEDYHHQAIEAFRKHHEEHQKEHHNKEHHHKEHHLQEHHEDHHEEEHHPAHIPLLDLHKPHVHEPYYGHRLRHYKRQEY